MRSDTQPEDRQQTGAWPHKRVTNYNTFRPDNCELNNNTNQHQQYERLWNEIEGKKEMEIDSFCGVSF